MAARIQPAETVVIHAAAGGVGTTVAQVARLLGAGTVIGTVGSPTKEDVARRAGCHHVINYREEDFAPYVHELTDDVGADVILDGVAGSVFAQSLECLAEFGRLVTYGMAGGEVGRLNTDQLQRSSRSVIGYSNEMFLKRRPSLFEDAARWVIEQYAARHLQPVIDDYVPLREIQDAHRRLESRTTVGRILLVPS